MNFQNQYGFVQKVFAKFLYPLIYPKISITTNIEKLGSHHGSKFVCETNLSENSTFISCGVGEDLSFEIELLERHKMNVILVDPTPRSIAHFEAILSRIGKINEIPYSLDGSQDPRSYDLSAIRASQFGYVQKAIWNKSTTLSFYPPTNKDHVSYSLGNIQRSDLVGFEPISVESTTLELLCKDFAITNLDLLKLDIEGSAFEVVQNAFENQIFPRQILVEFEEAARFSILNFRRLRLVFRLLNENNYSLISRTGLEFVFMRSM
jgi:FkbM family methyltransferase